MAIVRGIWHHVDYVRMKKTKMETMKMNKELMIKKAAEYPQAFSILPINAGQPKTNGTWAAYQFDNVVQFWINSSHPEALSFYKYIIKMEETQKMTKALTVQEEKNIQSLLSNNMKAIQSILPRHLTPEKAARLLYGLLTRNPMLGRCSQPSIINCFLEASALGLEIGGALHHASLIPFKNKRAGTYEATLVIEYNGKIMLANNTGNVKNVSAHAVYEKDNFSYQLGLNPDINHIPSEDPDPGPLRYAYAVINYLNGGQDFEVITRKVAMEAKARSAAKFKKDSPWNQEDLEYQQWKKTAIHRLMNRVPKSAEKIGQAPMDGVVPNHISAFDLDDVKPIEISEKTEPKKQPIKKKEPLKKKEEPTKEPEPEPKKDLSKEVMQVVSLADQFPEEFKQTLKEIGLIGMPETFSDDQAVSVCKKISEILDCNN